ncbi:hypothetical protein ACFQU2_20025 [Siccirubricoccus deserti]
MTKAFCALLGGDVAADSEPGQGTIFAVRLPADLRKIRTPDDDPVVAAREEPPRGKSTKRTERQAWCWWWTTTPPRAIS